ncbi:MAG: UDP-N-acetylglucosamine--N-acetylmuramyl-(pentapeptide) pyrophosphoryl-undecaprenol N-acetylglucosamine transferase [Microbacteriaceae bacterium]
MTTYLFAGGGTAGHVNPLLAVADKITAHNDEATALVLGTAEGLEARLVPERGYELITVARVPFPRRLNRSALSFPRRFRQAVTRTREIIRERRVDIVVGFGGYASAPAYVAARAEGIPIVIHEANAKPGIANRVGAYFATQVGVAFAGTKIRNATVVGMPLRSEVETLDKHEGRAEGLERFGFDGTKPVLLVTGGSSGARQINQTIAETVPLLLGSGWDVLHIAGAKSEIVDPHLEGYVLLRYCDDMHLALAVADLAVSRAGSATVSEFTALGVPAVYVPYPVGNGEQRFNVKDVVAAGGGTLVADRDFTPDWVKQNLVPILRDRALVAEMTVAAQALGSRSGAEQFITLVNRALAER